MADFEIIKLLFETHHRQLAEKRQKVHAITERTVGVLVIMTGWIVLGQRAPSGSLRWLLIATVLILAVTSCATEYAHTKAYLSIAQVIRKLNSALGVHDPGRFVEDETLYPDSWRSFGCQSAPLTVIHHWAIIWIMALASIMAVLFR